jgi:hypothetical protein
MNPFESNLLDPSFGGPPYPNQSFEVLSPTPTSPQPGVSAPWPVINIPDTPRVSEDKCPFGPVFSTSDGVVHVSIEPSGYLVDRGELGHHEGRLGLFGGLPINNPDPDDNDWEAPKKQLTNGNWVLWLVDDGNKNGTVVLSVELDTADDPEGGEFVDIWKLATFTVALSEVTTPIFYACNGLEHSRSTPTDFYPHLRFDTDLEKWSVSFTQGYLHHVNDSTVSPFLIAGSEFEAAGEFDVEDGDEWFAHVSTDSDGLVGVAGVNFEKNPVDSDTVEFIEDLSAYSVLTTGEYYYKVVSFALVGDVMTPTVFHKGGLDWHIRSMSNIGTGLELINNYSLGSYEFRSIVGDTEPFVPPEDSSEEPKDVWVSVELDKNEEEEIQPGTIKVIAKVNVPVATKSSVAITGLPPAAGDLHPIAVHNNGALPAGVSTTISETITKVYQTSSSVFTYTDEAGVETPITMPSGGTGNTSTMTPPITGHEIATHGDGTGATVDINETITTIVASAGQFVYTDEAGFPQTVTIADLGYDELPFYVCENGLPVSKTFLVKL